MADLPLFKNSFNQNLIYAGFFLLTCSVATLIYFYLIEPNTKDGWQIKITGITKIKDINRIEKNILYFIDKSSRVSASEISQSLELDPSIQSASVNIKPGKILKIEIKKSDVTFLYNSNGKIQEFNEKLSILQEDSLGYAHTIPANFPIVSIYKKSLRSNITLKELFKVYQKTKKSMKFIWQRISEIVITKNKILLYPTVARCQISFSMLNEGILKRVWSILYYFEKIASKKEKFAFKIIELNKNNAIIRSREV